MCARVSVFKQVPTRIIYSSVSLIRSLQIATTSFGESASPLHGQAMISKDAAANTTSLPDQVRWLHLILEAVGRETEALALFEIHMKGYAVPTSAAVGAGSSLLDQPLSSLASPGIGVDSLRASPTASKKSDIAPSMDHLLKLTLPQVHRLLVSNYWYERDESRLHPDVSGVLALLVDTMHSFSFDQQRLIGSGITGAQHESQGGPGKLLGYAPASPLALSTGANANTQTTITTQIEHLTMLLLQTTTSKPDSSLFEPIATRRWQLDTVRLQDTLAVLPRDGGDFLPSVVHDRMADVKLGRRIVAPEWVLTKLGGGRA